MRTADVLVGLGFEAGVCIHGECEELPEGGERAQQQHDDASALDGLDGACQQVGSDAFKVLQRHWSRSAGLDTRRAGAGCACMSGWAMGYA